MIKIQDNIKSTISIASLSKYDRKVAFYCWELWLSEHVIEKDLSKTEKAILQRAFLSGFASFDAQISLKPWIAKLISKESKKDYEEFQKGLKKKKGLPDNI